MAHTSTSLLTIALVGNPNTGKSTLFSALAGVRQRVGNYPGVTVEKKIGAARFESQAVELVDLPGTYSLAPRSLDEMVAVEVLLGRREDSRPVDVVLSIVDASNLERNLYLLSQVLELGLPTVVALNMTDIARERAIEIDAAELRRRLGVPVIEVQAHKRIGLDQLKAELVKAAQQEPAPPPSPFAAEFQREVEQLQQALSEKDEPAYPRYLAERLLLDTSGMLQTILLTNGLAERNIDLTAARTRLAAAGQPVPAVEAIARYGWVAQVLNGVVRRPTKRVVTSGDRVDRLLTHKVGGTVVFVLLMRVINGQANRVLPEVRRARRPGNAA